MKSKSINRNCFVETPMDEKPQEELFAQDWQNLLDNHIGSTWDFLRKIFIELNFPICKGQKENPIFLMAVKYGILPKYNEKTWNPKNPDGIKVYIYPTLVGRIPVIECESELDFIMLLQSLVYRCEPHNVPDVQGASILKNYTNWARARMNQKNEVGGLLKNPDFYRDYIVLLSHRYYSGINPEVFGLQDSEWRHKSLIIRREHEVAHYMTQRFYHSCKNEIHDEIIADFMGLTAAFEEYDPIKFLTFLGLERYPHYRHGSRLEIYVSSNEDFDSLCATLFCVAHNIADYYKNNGSDRIKMFHTLCRTSIADMERGNFYD